MPEGRTDTSQRAHRRFGARGAALCVAFSTSCTASRPGTSAGDAGEPARPARTVVEAAPAAASTDSQFRLVYRGCPQLGVAAIDGEVFVHYVVPGVARVERLGPRGAPVATFDLDLGVPVRPVPETPPERDGSGQYSPSLPLGHVLDLAGPDPDDLYLLASFHYYGESWRSRVYHYRGGRWSATAVEGSQELFPWGTDAVLAFGRAGLGLVAPELRRLPEDPALSSYFTPLLEHAARAGAGVGATEEGVGHTGVKVLALDVARHGPVFAVTKFQLEPPSPGDRAVGTWLMVWDGARRSEVVVRLTETVAERADVVADAAGGAYVHMDSALFRWTPNAGVEPIDVSPAPSEGRFRLAGVDPEGRLWAWRDGLVEHLDAASRRSEVLPGVSPIRTLQGVRFGTPWALREDHTLWSRGADGTWSQSDLPEELSRPTDKGSSVRLVVAAAGDPWLIRDYPATGTPRVQYSHLPDLDSDLYTLRPAVELNPCRVGAAH